MGSASPWYANQTKTVQKKKREREREKIKHQPVYHVNINTKSKTKSEQIKYTIYKTNNACQPRGVCCRNARVVQYLKIKQYIKPY